MKVHISRHHKDITTGSTPSQPAQEPPPVADQGQHTVAWMDFSRVEAYDNQLALQAEFDLETLLIDAVDPALLSDININHSTQGLGVTIQQGSLFGLPTVSWRKSFQISESKRGEMAALMRKQQSSICNKELELEFPAPLAIQRYVAAFFDVFPSIIPCFHLPTWNAEEQPPVLLLAITALGAAVCDKTTTSLALYRAAQMGIWNYIVRSVEHLKDSWVKCETESPQSWAQWLEAETVIRTKLSVYVYFGQLNIAFNMPFLLVNEEVDIALPCAEEEWQAASEAQWSQVRSRAQPGTSGGLRFLEALETLLGRCGDVELDANVERLAWTPFGSLVILYAILQEIWQIRRYVNGHRNLVAEQLQRFEHGLCRLERIWEASAQYLPAGSLPQPILLDANALFNAAYFRLHANLPRPKPGLLSFDQDLMMQVTTQFIKHVSRSVESNRAACYAIRALLMPFTAGLEWTHKNMAGVCSLHFYFISSMQSCLYLSRWLESLASVSMADWNPDEQKVVELTRTALNEIGVDEDFSHAPLHVQLLQGWCLMFKNPGQWGFAADFVQIMRRYAESMVGQT
ncbi:hypothetical protein BDV06DRAFT_227488 [Aspergillus oleicola]